MNIPKTLGTGIIAGMMAMNPMNADARATTPTNEYNERHGGKTLTTMNGKSIEQICKSVGNKAHVIMDQSENTLVACNNGKPAYPHIIRATYNKGGTPTGTYQIDRFDATKTNHKGVRMPYAMHVNMPHTQLNAIWVHEARIFESNGSIRNSSGCVGIHHTHAKPLFQAMQYISNTNQKITITIQK